MYAGQEHYGYKSGGGVRGSAAGWIEKGMMDRNRQIFMNMQPVSLYSFCRTAEVLLSLLVLMFWSLFSPRFCFSFTLLLSLSFMLAFFFLLSHDT